MYSHTVLPTRLSREVRMFLPLTEIYHQSLQQDQPENDSVSPNNGTKQGLNRWMSVFPVSLSDPYVILRLSIQGTPDQTTGYLVDIRKLDRWAIDSVKSSLELFFSENKQQGPGSENRLFHWIPILMNQLAERVHSETSFLFEKLELAFSPYLRFAAIPSRTEPSKMPAIVVTEQFEFSAAHRLHCNGLSDQENLELFGKCNHPSGHGHNYRLEVSCQIQDPQSVDKEKGELWNWLNQLVSSEVLDRLDHKFLNIDLPEFQNLNPSVENIAAVVYQWLLPHFDESRKLAGVRLFETEKTWAEVGF